MSRLRSDAGSAIVEFTLFAVVAIVPLAWAAVSLQQLLAVQQAVDAAAGESLRAYLTSSSQEQARQRAEVAAGLALEQHPAVVDLDVGIACDRSRCLAAGASVRVRVAATAELPEIPVLGIRPTLRASSEQYGVVDAYVAGR